jgi:hypothetical protein
MQDGFGINSDLPREPYLPWNRWWWTRMFDAGFKWIRIGQYENSSDRTSWDWIEQKRGVLASSSELEDQVDSLVDNGMKIQVQLLYGNVMYTSPSGTLPDVSVPELGSFHNDDRSLYSVLAAQDPEQIARSMLRNMDGEYSRIVSSTGPYGMSRTLDIGIPGAMPRNSESCWPSLRKRYIKQPPMLKSSTVAKRIPRANSRRKLSTFANVPQKSMCMHTTPIQATVKTSIQKQWITAPI